MSVLEGQVWKLETSKPAVQGPGEDREGPR